MGQLELQDLLADVAGGVEPAGPAIVDRALGEARRRRAARFLALPAIVVAAAGSAGLIALPHLWADGVQPAAAGRAVVPRELPGYSLLTASAQDAPGGRAIAILNYYNWDTVRTVALGADGRTLRELGPDSAELSYGASALSPDGTHAALALRDGRLVVQDLATGTIRTVHRPSSDGPGAEQVRYAPDGASVAYTAAGAGLYLADLATGVTTRVTAQSPDEFAFSPDGTRLAVQHGAAITVADRTGRATFTARVPSAGDRLSGQNAWSPDGRYLVTVHTPGGSNVPCTFRFVATSGNAAADGSPPARIVTDGALVGWRGPGELLIQESGAGEHHLTVRDTATWSRTVLSGLHDAYIGSIATDLAATAAPADVEPGAGPWPGWFAAILAGAAVGVALLIALLWLVARWAIRVNRTPFPDQ